MSGVVRGSVVSRGKEREGETRLVCRGRMRRVSMNWKRRRARLKRGDPQMNPIALQPCELVGKRLPAKLSELPTLREVAWSAWRG